MSNDNQVKIDITAEVQGFNANMASAQANLERIAKAFDKGGAATREYTKHADAAEQMTNKMSNATSNLTGIVKQAAAAFGLYKLAEYIKDAALLNARYETLGISMAVVGKNAGYSASQMEDAAVSMQKTGISMVESRQQAMRLVQAHIDLAQSTKLARIAQDAAVIGNMNSSEAFANMIHGIQSGQTDVLKNIGLNVSMEQSYKLMAQQLHKNVDALSQNEKTQSILNAVLLAGEDIAGTYEAAMGTAGKQINSMTRYLEDLKVKQGEVFNELLTVAVMAFTEQLKDANGELDEMAKNGQIKKWGNDVTDIFVGLADNINNMAGAMRIVTATIGASYAAMRNPSNFGEYKAAYDKEVAEILAGEDRFGKALVLRRQATAEKTAADTANKKASDLKSTADYMAKVEALDARYFASRTMTAKQYDAEMAKLANGDNHKFKDTASTAKDSAAESAIKHANDFIKSLKLQDEQLGLDEGQKKLVEAATISLTVKSEALRSKIMEAAKAYAVNFTAQQKAVEAEKHQAVAVEALIKKYDEMEMAKSDAAKSTNDYVVSLGEGNRQREFEIGLMGQSETARNISIGQYQIEKDLQAQILKIKTATTDEDERARQIVAVTDAAGHAKASLAQYIQINDQMKEWNALWGTVEKTGKDAFVHLFSDGKNAFEGIGKALKASVIDLLYQLTVRKWMISIGTSLSGSVLSGAAQAADGSAGTGVGGWLNAGSTSNKLSGSNLSSFTSWDGFSNSASFGANSVGQSLYDAGYQSSGSYLMENASTIGDYASTAGQVMGYASALYSASEGKWGAAIGQAVGTYFFGPLGATIGGYLGGVVDDFFGGGGGPKIGGWAEQTKAGNINYSNSSGGDPFKSQDTAAMMLATVSGVAKNYGKSLSDEFRFGLSYELDPQGDAPGSVGYSVNGVTTRKEINGQDVEAGAKEFAVMSQRGLLAALAEIDLSPVVDPLLDALGDVSTMTEESVRQTLDAIGSLTKASVARVEGVFGETFDASKISALSLDGENLLLTFSRLTDEFILTSKVADLLGHDVSTAFGAIGLASLKAREDFIAMMGGMAQMTATTQSYYTNFFTDTERHANDLEALGLQFAALNVLMPTTRDGYRELVEAQDLSNESGRTMAAALLNLNGAFAAVVPAVDVAADSIANLAAAAVDSATQAASDAMSGVTRAVSAEKDRLTAVYDAQVEQFTSQLDTVSASVGKLQTLASSLKSTLNGMQIAGSDAAYRQAAQAQISAALATARSGGGLPLDGQLDSALQAISQPSEGLFSSFEDYARDFYKTATDISALNDLTGEQLSADEATQAILKAQLSATTAGYDAEMLRLDAVVTAAQAQLDALNGINDSVLSVVDAVAGLNTAILALAVERTTQGLPTASVAAASAYGNLGSSGMAENNSAYSHPSGVVVVDGKDSALVAAAKLVYQSATGGVSTAQFNAAQAAVGGDIYGATGWNGDPESFRKIYGFAVGTNQVPYDMVANIHADERIIPAADNRELMSRLRNPQANNDALIAEIKLLREEVSGLRAEAKATAGHTAKTSRLLDRAMPDGDALATRVAA